MRVTSLIAVCIFIMSCNQEYVIVLHKKSSEEGFIHKIEQKVITANSDENAYKEGVLFFVNQLEKDSTINVDSISIYDYRREKVFISPDKKIEIELNILRKPYLKSSILEGSLNTQYVDSLRHANIYVVYSYIRITMLKIEQSSFDFGKKIANMKWNNNDVLTALKVHEDSIHKCYQAIKDIKPTLETTKLYDLSLDYLRSSLTYFSVLREKVESGEVYHKASFFNYLKSNSYTDSERMTKVTNKFYHLRDMYELDKVKIKME